MRPRPRPLKASKRTRGKLERLACACSAEHRLVVRAKLVVMALEGWGNAQIARQLGISERTAYEWTERFARRPRLSTLRDRPRSGRPSTISVTARCEVIAAW
jgi:transposase